LTFAARVSLALAPRALPRLKQYHSAESFS
jgi:hypothetical protein